MLALVMVAGSIAVSAEEGFLGIPQEHKAFAQQFANS